MKNNIIFFFAHQDDELGIISIIENYANQDNSNVICLFMTDGGLKSETRNHESTKVLKRIGVQSKNIRFIGKDLNFKDGHLSKNISKLSDWINSFLSKVENIESMYVTAYEGGHQDHDALHVATVIASKKNNLKNKLFQFPLYNSYKCLKPFFAVLSPLPVNGEIIKIPISLKDRIKGTLFCLSYPSQIKTWIGLFPFFLFYFLTNNSLKIQKVSVERVLEKPHEGSLLYETRKFYTWDKFSKDIKPII